MRRSWLMSHKNMFIERNWVFKLHVFGELEVYWLYHLINLETVRRKCRLVTYDFDVHTSSRGRWAYAESTITIDCCLHDRSSAVRRFVLFKNCALCSMEVDNAIQFTRSTSNELIWILNALDARQLDNFPLPNSWISMRILLGLSDASNLYPSFSGAPNRIHLHRKFYWIHNMIWMYEYHCIKIGKSLAPKWIDSTNTKKRWRNGQYRYRQVNQCSWRDCKTEQEDK